MPARVLLALVSVLGAQPAPRVALDDEEIEALAALSYARRQGEFHQQCRRLRRRRRCCCPSLSPSPTPPPPVAAAARRLLLEHVAPASPLRLRACAALAESPPRLPPALLRPGVAAAITALDLSGRTDWALPAAIGAGVAAVALAARVPAACRAAAGDRPLHGAGQAGPSQSRGACGAARYARALHGAGELDLSCERAFFARGPRSGAPAGARCAASARDGEKAAICTYAATVWSIVCRWWAIRCSRALGHDGAVVVGVERCADPHVRGPQLPSVACGWWAIRCSRALMTRRRGRGRCRAARRSARTRATAMRSRACRWAIRCSRALMTRRRGRGRCRAARRSARTGPQQCGLVPAGGGRYAVHGLS